MTEANVLNRAQKFAARIAVLEARIAKDTAELDDVRLESETAGRLSSVNTGSVITARLGRAGSAEVLAAAAVYEDDGVTVKTPAVAAKAATAGTLRFVKAEVLGVKEEQNGSLRYKITFGEGFDKDVEIIQASQITEVHAESDPVVDAALNPSAAAAELYSQQGVGY